MQRTFFYYLIDPYLAKSWHEDYSKVQFEICIVNEERQDCFRLIFNATNYRPDVGDIAITVRHNGKAPTWGLPFLTTERNLSLNTLRELRDGFALLEAVHSKIMSGAYLKTHDYPSAYLAALKECGIKPIEEKA